jgi:putative spermidine/putrescine transport system substrate-binding protein
MYRRDFLKASAATAIGLSGLGRSIPSHAAQSMAMLTWGGLWGNGMAQYVDTPFAAKTGYSIIQDRGPTPVERVTKLKIDLLNQPYDLIQIHDGVVPLAESQGVLEPLDLTSPNLQLLKDVPARFRRPGWVAMIYSALGIVYNKEQVKKPPRSFADLWDPEYQGRIVLPQITHSIGPYIIPIGAMAAGKDPKDAQAGFDMLRKMVKLQPVWADDTDTIMNALQSGDAAIGLLYKSQCFTIQDKGAKVEWVFPGEGAISYLAGTGIAKNTKHRALAEQYINMTISPQYQAWTAKVFNYAGSNPKMLALLPPELQQRVQFSQAQIGKIIDLDQQFISTHRADWTDQWNRIVNGA